MSNSLPMRISGSPCISIEEDLEPNEYYGHMTYIRVEGVGEHKEDKNGLVLWLCGTYSPDLLERIALTLIGK